MRALLLSVALLTACGAGPKPFADYPEECQLPALAKIQLAYTAELLFACKHYDSLDDCPNAPLIDERYQARFDEWENCNPADEEQTK